MINFENFREGRLYKAVNKEVGLAALFFALVFFVIVIFYYVLRTCQSGKNLFHELFSFLTGDEGAKTDRGRPTTHNTKSIVAKFLRATIFLLLSAGFVAVIYYNVHKMLTDDPILSVKVENNKYTPSIMFCSFISDAIKISTANYFANVDDDKPTDLTNLFKNITLGTGENQLNCTLFNDKLFKRPEENIGGIYNFALSSNTNIVFIGDFDNIDMTSHSFPQGSVHSNVGTQFITSVNTILKYDETRYIELEGGKINRSYQLTQVGGSGPGPDEVIVIDIIAPTSVIVDTEEPPIDLAACFGNIGGYLTICGIFGFLFGSGRMSPFGFVTQYCFQYKDLNNDDLEAGNYLEGGNETNSDKDIVEKSKFETVLKKLYVDMDHMDHMDLK